MTELQRQIYDMIKRWEEFAATTNLTPNFYHAWALRANFATSDEINAALRQLLDNGYITATTHKVLPCAETLYDITPNTKTVTILKVTDKNE